MQTPSKRRLERMRLETVGPRSACNPMVGFPRLQAREEVKDGSFEPIDSGILLVTFVGLLILSQVLFDRREI
mgnify:CR=1 FL=1